MLKKILIVLLISITLTSCRNKEQKSNNEVTKSEKNQVVDTVRNIKKNINVSNLNPRSNNIIFRSTFKDNNSEKIFIVSESQEEGYLKQLFFDIYIMDNELKRHISVYDFIKECPVDYTLEYLNNSFEITDLDNDENKEISFLYSMSCKGDISPSKMKLVLIEDNTKYKLRGLRRLKINSSEEIEEYGYGKYEADSFMLNGPEEFLNFSKEKWQKFVLEN